RGRASAAKHKGELSSKMNCHPERSRWESEANPPAESKDPYPLIRIRMFQLNLGAPFKPDFGLIGAVAPASQHSRPRQNGNADASVRESRGSDHEPARNGEKAIADST